MVDVNFVFTTLSGEEIKAENVSSYEIRKDKDAPCDSLRLYFYPKETLPELVEIKVYSGFDLVFNGLVDVQEQSLNDETYPCYIYARSTACLLVDNEAKPFTYYSPSAKALYLNNCGDYPFDCKLPTDACDTYYQVDKGTTCFELLDDFVCNFLGEHIRVNQNNEIEILRSKNVLELDGKKLISTKHSINRGGALTRIDYKNSSNTDYKYHMKSRFIEGRNINRSIVKNLSTIPDWQKEECLLDIMKNANDEYYAYKFEVLGYIGAELMDEIKFGSLENVFVSSVKHLLDKKGERTIITANQKQTLREVRYVD